MHLPLPGQVQASSFHPAVLCHGTRCQARSADSCRAGGSVALSVPCVCSCLTLWHRQELTLRLNDHSLPNCPNLHSCKSCCVSWEQLLHWIPLFQLVLLHQTSRRDIQEPSSHLCTCQRESSRKLLDQLGHFPYDQKGPLPSADPDLLCCSGPRFGMSFINTFSPS